MNIIKTHLTTYATHIVELETEDVTYTVTFSEYDFHWNTLVMNVDDNEEVDESDPIYQELVDAADNLVWHTPEQDCNSI